VPAISAEVAWCRRLLAAVAGKSMAVAAGDQ